MGNYDKMRRTNSKVRKWLVENKYEDISFFPHTRYFKDIHFQGLEFDGLCSKDGILYLFQVKSNQRAPKRVLEAYRVLAVKFKSIKCIWFNWVDRKGLEVNNEMPIQK